MRKNSYDLSIIIPIRNTPLELISRCLRSVFQAIYNGKHFSTKVILIDDFSSYTHYVNYSRSILQKHPNILLKRTDTCFGIGRARNYGASLIRSRYLLFIDSDDIVSEKLIMRLLPNCTEKGICFANHIKVLSKKTKKYDKRIFTEVLKIFPKQFDSPFLYTNFVGMPAIIPKELFVKVGGYAEGIYSGEHISLWGKLYLRGLLKEIKYVDEILYEYHPYKKGNCLKDVGKHIKGKSDQFRLLLRAVNLDHDSLLTFQSKSNLPRIYLPVKNQEFVYLPKWVKISDDMWLIDKTHFERN